MTLTSSRTTRYKHWQVWRIKWERQRAKGDAWGEGEGCSSWPSCNPSVWWTCLILVITTCALLLFGIRLHLIIILDDFCWWLERGWCSTHVGWFTRSPLLMSTSFCRTACSNREIRSRHRPILSRLFPPPPPTSSAFQTLEGINLKGKTNFKIIVWYHLLEKLRGTRASSISSGPSADGIQFWD